MLNVQALSSTLSSMSLPQLQQYASLHKNDPYVVTMALSIANQKKQAMTAAQGQAGMQPMPKVVDQELAALTPKQQLPEETGIGQLPAGEMNFAGGGIVAFGSGGDVPRYQVVGVTPLSAGTEYEVPGMATGNLYQQAMTKAQQGRPLSGVEKALLASATPLAAVADTAMLPVTAFRKLVRSPLDTSPEPSWFPTTSAATKELSRQIAPPEASYSNEGRRTAPVGVAALAAERAAEAGEAPPPQQLPPRAPAAVPAAGLPGLITTPAQMQEALRKAQEGASPEVPSSISGGIEDIRREEASLAEQNRDALMKEQAARGIYGLEQESRLKTRQGRIEKQERDLAPMALIQAGLAIMGGTSPYAFANIGAGAQVGLKAYTEGADKISDARDKLDDAFSKIEDIRRNESRMDAKELREATNAIKQTTISAKKQLQTALEKDWGLKRQEALKGVELLMTNQRSMYEQQQANARTNAQIAATLNTPERQMWDDALRKHKGNTTAAFKELQTAKAEKFNPYQSYADYLKAFAGKDTGQPPLNFADYVSQFAVPVSAPPKDAAIRKLPGTP